MNFTPLRGKVLVRLCSPPTEVGGILLPQKNAVHGQHSPHLDDAEVVAVGAGIESMKVGDKVLLRQREGVAVKIDDQKCFLFDEDKIMAIV